MANGPARHGTLRAAPGRRAYRAVPDRVSCLAFGPSTALRADFRAVPARSARQNLRAVPAQSPVYTKMRIFQIQTSQDDFHQISITFSVFKLHRITEFILAYE